MTREDVLVGIDAGGSSTRVRARLGPRTVFEGEAGPGNPLTMSASELRSNLQAACSRCPTPAVVVACVAGAGSRNGKRAFEEALAEIWPGVPTEVVPDYVGALRVLSGEAEVCVLAGTGSVVCSENNHGTLAVTGGKGWILGDHGSASRLGQMLLDHVLADPDAVAPTLQRSILDGYRLDDLRQVISLVHGADAPARLLAQAAPMLTDLAEAGDAWANDALVTSMGELAGTVAQHIQTYLPDVVSPRVALIGGVWSSASAVDVFIDALAVIVPEAIVADMHTLDPVDGALAIAASRTC